MENEMEKSAAPVTELVAEFVATCQALLKKDGTTVEWNHLELEGAGRGVMPTRQLTMIAADRNE